MLRATSQRPEPQASPGQEELPGELAGLHVPAEEWRAIVTVRPNVLIEGPEGSSEKLVRAVTALHGAVYDWGFPQTEPVPGATLIVRHIDVLSDEDQRRLLDFLSAEGREARVWQVISTSARPLYSLVGSGLFLADLYYRLNTIRLELAEAS